MSPLAQCDRDRLRSPLRPLGAIARRPRAVRRRFRRGEGGVRPRRLAAARRAGAGARRSRARALRRYWQLKSRLDDAAPEAVSVVPRPLSRRAARRSTARRLAEVARQARRLEPVRARLSAGASARTPSSRATRCSTATSATARRRLPRRSRCGSPGQSTPDACEPLFAALIARGDLSLADRRARFRLAAAAGNARLAQAIADDASRRRTGSPRASSPRSIAIRCARWPRASLPGRRARDASSRSTRSSARHARTRPRRASAWVKWRGHFAGTRPQLRQPAHRVPRGAPARSVGEPWFREVARRRADARRAGVARARGVARRRVGDVQPRDRRAAGRRPAGTRRGATGARARWPRRTHDDEARAIYASLAVSPSYYGLLAAEALGPRLRAARSARAIRSPSTIGVARGVRRAAGRDPRRQARAARPAPRVDPRMEPGGPRA